MLRYRNHRRRETVVSSFCVGMSARSLLNSTGQAAPSGDPLLAQVWDASFRAGSDAFAQEVPLQLRLRAGLAELSVNLQDGSHPHALDERESLLQCGAALFHLKLALRRFGRLGQLELFPDLDQLSLVARVSGEFDGMLDTAKSVLIKGLSRTQSEAACAGEVAVSAQILAQLCAAGSSAKAWLAFSQCEASRKRLCEMEAVKRPSPGSGIGQADEDTSRTTPPGATPFGALRSAWVHLRASPMASRLLGPSGRTPASPKTRESMSVERPQNMVALAVLKTKTDDPYGWLAAGEILAQVQLEAAKLNVFSHVFYQAFQARQARQELRNIIGRKGFVQAIVGFGLTQIRSSAEGPWVPQHRAVPREGPFLPQA
jgi:hypothetical protein